MDMLAQAILNAALSGDMKAAAIILDRIDPAPKQSLTINNNVLTPVQVREEIVAGLRQLFGKPHSDGGNGRCQ